MTKRMELDAGQGQTPGPVSVPARMIEKEQRLTLFQRIVSASVGAMLTSLLVTPLDVVKTRLQAQARVESNPKNAAQCPRCAYINFSNGLMDHTLPRYVVCTHTVRHFTGTLDAFYKITRYEGVASLYNGLPPTLLMAVPATVLYFATYDKLRLQFEQANYGWMSSALLSGSCARVVAATCIAPIELVRTKMQAMQDPPNMLRTAANQVRGQGVFSLWKGLSPTLLRDVPFSAIYWVSVEGGKRRLAEMYPTISDVYASFISGAIGGTIAATCTIPFDVVKTRKQVFDYSPDPAKEEMTTRRILNRIIKTEGYSGLFVGIGPRLMKISPACALMLSSYEFGKQVFLEAEDTSFASHYSQLEGRH